MVAWKAADAKAVDGQTKNQKTRNGLVVGGNLQIWRLANRTTLACKQTMKGSRDWRLATGERQTEGREKGQEMTDGEWRLQRLSDDDNDCGWRWCEHIW